MTLAQSLICSHRGNTVVRGHTHSRTRMINTLIASVYVDTATLKELFGGLLGGPLGAQSVQVGLRNRLPKTT